MAVPPATGGKARRKGRTRATVMPMTASETRADLYPLERREPRAGRAVLADGGAFVSGPTFWTTVSIVGLSPRT